MSLVVQANAIDSATTAFFLCDMQEKFQPAIDHFFEIAECAKRLVSASKILNVPLIVTEQYPKGLGSTISTLDISHAVIKEEKTKFTMFSDKIKDYLAKNSIKSVILFGVEAHVCVLQTAIDLISNGYHVQVVADASSSRTLTDRRLAFDRLRQLGVVVTSYESVLFQLVGDKNHEKFKEIQGIVKTVAPDTGIFSISSSL